MTLRVSRDDDRYPKKAPLINGLAVKVKDTDDDSPVDADMEVYLGRTRIANLKDLPVDTVIGVLDESAKPYEIVIMHIYDKDETVTVGIRKK